MPEMRSGLIALSDGVRAQFDTLGVPAVVTPVGWKYRSFVVNQGPGGAARVSFMPGKIDPSSPAPPKVADAGTFEQPTFTSNGGRFNGLNANPRRLIDWRRIVSLSVWAVDTTDTSNDELQFAALENLVEATYAAMHNAVDPVTGVNVGLADINITQAVYTRPPVEGAFGMELVAYFEHLGPLYDNPIGIVIPTANPITRQFEDQLT
jgi:hypothetical protein